MELDLTSKFFKITNQHKDAFAMFVDSPCCLVSQATLKQKNNQSPEKSEYKKLLISKCNSKYNIVKNHRLLNYLQNILESLLKSSEKLIKISDICKKYIIAYIHHPYKLKQI